jgi:cell division GTPase FtsZ
MGGGTGRGAAPVVANVARQQGACTISIAMVPEQQQTSQSVDLVRCTQSTK